MNCVEVLIEVSSHELNDDDMDGRTPLLLASMTGHQQVVQVLISLGGDVSKRCPNPNFVNKVFTLDIL